MPGKKRPPVLPGERIIQTSVGSLPEEFFVVERKGHHSPTQTPHKAKLREQLAQAYNIWRSARDDDEGWKKRRKAAQLAVGAMIECASAETEVAIARGVYAAEGIPAEHLRPLVEIVVALGDLNSKKRPYPELLKRPVGVSGNPGLGTADTAGFAAACAAADVLSEQQVARALGMSLGAFRSRRKAFKAGQRGPEARDTYHKMREIFQKLDSTSAAQLLATFYPGPK
jgi:hypothetical protein